MADGRLPAVTPGAIQPIQPRDVTGAQRAFFEAALGKVQAPAAPQAPQSAQPAARTAVQPHVTRVDSAEVPNAPQPGARYRPGMLLNIKI